MPRKPRPIRIRFRRLPKHRGLADHDRREITLDPTQSETSLLGSAIHEVLHLELWDLDESAVLRTEKSIVDVLLRLDFRRMIKDGE
jgi:hypothetical protein